MNKDKISNSHNHNPDGMSRSELQRSLKSLGLRATGTTVALRERYTLHYADRTTNDGEPNHTSLKSNVCEDKFAAGDGSTCTDATQTTTATTIAGKEKGDTKDNTKKQAEKRLKRYRSFCPQSIRQRIDRALTQRLFLIKRGDVLHQDHCHTCDFHVLGSTGNVYTVTVRKVAHCTCPDHAKGNLCKHILFVLLKVMSLDSDSPLVYQAAWIESEMEEMFKLMEQRYGRLGGSGVLANSKVRESFAKLEQGEDVEVDNSGVACKQINEGDDCPICFDVLETKNSGPATTVHCRGRCGANFHKSCIAHWLQQNRQNPTCPMCRVEWEDGTVADTNNEGFSNLGKLQGQSSKRDTSSYYSSGYGWYSYKRRRY